MEIYEHQFVIFDKSGTIYWAHSDLLEPVQDFICRVLIDGRVKDNEYQYDKYSIRWITSNEYGITFANVFEKGYADKLSSFANELLENVKSIVFNKYIDKLKNQDIHCLKDFEKTYSKILKQTSEKLFINNEKKNGNIKDQISNLKIDEEPETKKEEQKVETKKIPSFLKNKPIKKGGKRGKSTPTKSSTSQPPREKKSRDWNNKISKEEMEKLNFSNDKNEVVDDEYTPAVIDDMKFESDSEDDDFNDDFDEKEETSSSSWSSGLFKYVKNLTQVELKDEKLAPILLDIKNHLVTKNVSYKTAEEICDSVRNSLVGKTHTSFKSITTTVKEAITAKLTKVLSQNKVDIAMEILDAKEKNRPYVITFVGVNGVGKSTSLSKVCAWLLSQKFTVMIAACDSFRSGAIEQLAVHSRNLNVPLFKQDYGADPAAIAAAAIKKAKLENIDVVLVDTAGRMQDNTNHMKELGKLININKPDLIIFVGEALVGNESNNQLKKFNESIIQHSSKGIDGIFLTKFDTVDDKVGAAISMVHETGHPILFVGVGQSYSDIRTLNVKKVVNILTK